MINEIEKVQFDAWPALRTFVYDGWLLRTSEGVTRRSNSISPIYSSSIELDKKIIFCEDYYCKTGLPVIFKLTDDVYPEELDAELDKRGYVIDAETSVQIMDIKQKDLEMDNSLQINDSLDDQWLKRFIDYNGYDTSKTDGYGHIIKAISLKKGLFDLIVKDDHIGCGLGVIHGDYLGVFDIVIAPEFRRRGYGKKIVESIMAWGKMNGSKLCYLQVMTDNPQAIDLYSKIGFREVYKYWYRIKID